MKLFLADLLREIAVASHPARGAWIEILVLLRREAGLLRRTPQGVRGLKY